MLNKIRMLAMKTITFRRPLTDLNKAMSCFRRLGTVFIAFKGRNSLSVRSGRKLIPGKLKSWVSSSKSHDTTTTKSTKFHPSRR